MIVLDTHCLLWTDSDRFIVATALSRDAILVTADEKILRWNSTLKRQDART